MKIHHPYLLFLGDARDELAAKTAFGIYDWAPDACLGQLRLPGCAAKLPIADMGIEEAVQKGAKTLVIGVANAGGTIPEHWLNKLQHALNNGLDIASGLHQRIREIPELAALAQQQQRQLLDVRHPDQNFAVGNGSKRSGQRLLTVGTDCSVGKMYTSLAIHRELQRRKFNCDFRATGQTGILIAGDGVSVDAVVADFISGAVEFLSPAAPANHWDIIEGQGSLFHPSFAGVSLGLLHGAQAHVLVLCHEPTRSHMRGLPHQALPTVGDCIAANIAAARVVNPGVIMAGIAVNTKALNHSRASDLLNQLSDQHQLPCVDPLRDGVASLVDAFTQSAR